MSFKQGLIKWALGATATTAGFGYARAIRVENIPPCYLTSRGEVICAEPAVKCTGQCSFELNKPDLECRLDLPSTQPRAELRQQGTTRYIYPRGYSAITEPVKGSGEIVCTDYLLFGKFWKKETRQKVQFTVAGIEQPPSPLPLPLLPLPSPPERDIVFHLPTPPFYGPEISVKGRVTVAENGEEQECRNPQLRVNPRRGYLWPRRDGSFTVQLPFNAGTVEPVKVPANKREEMLGRNRFSRYTLTAACENAPTKEFKLYIGEPTQREIIEECNSLEGLVKNVYDQKGDKVPLFETIIGGVWIPEDGSIILNFKELCGGKIDWEKYYVGIPVKDLEKFNIDDPENKPKLINAHTFQLKPDPNFNSVEEKGNQSEELGVMIVERAEQPENNVVIKEIGTLYLFITPTNDAPLKHTEMEKNLTDLPLGRPRSLGKCLDYFRDVDKGETLTCTVTSSCGENKYPGPDKQLGLQIDDARCAGEQTITIKVEDKAGEGSNDTVTRKVVFHLPDTSTNRSKKRRVTITRLVDSDEGVKCNGTRTLDLQRPAQEIEDNIRTYENSTHDLPAEIYPLHSIYRSQENKLNEQVTLELTNESEKSLSPQQRLFLGRININAALRGTLPKEKLPTNEQVCLDVLIDD